MLISSLTSSTLLDAVELGACSVVVGRGETELDGSSGRVNSTGAGVELDGCKVVCGSSVTVNDVVAIVVVVVVVAAALGGVLCPISGVVVEESD